MVARTGHSRPWIFLGALAGVALMTAAVVRSQPLVALAIPGVLVTAALCVRAPAASLLVVLLLAGANSSLQAFTGLNPGPVVDLLIAGLWAGVVLSQVMRGRERPIWVWLGIVLIVAYAAITFAEILTASSISLGLRSFHNATWFLLVVVLLAVAGWRIQTHERVAKAVVFAALAVAGYATFRLIYGPAAEEASFAAQSSGFYNVIDDKLALIGSFSSRHSLAFWTACSAPFCLASIFVLRGVWRALAGVAGVLCVVAMFGTQVRAALPGLVFGVLIVIALFQLSGGMRGAQVARSGAAALIALVIGAAAFSLVVGGGQSANRYEAIVSPSGDPAWEQRIGKWSEALRDVDDHPFGQGLGTAGVLQELGQGPYVNIASYSLDSSYLKIAYEQGLIILALFVAAMLALLGELCRFAIRSRDRTASGLAIGAAGSLTAGLTMFVTGQYIEGLTALAMWIPVGIGVGAIASERAAESPEQPSGTAPALTPREIIPSSLASLQGSSRPPRP